MFGLAVCSASDAGPTATVPTSWLGFQDAVAYPSGGTGITSLAARDVTGDNVPDLIAVTRGEAVHVLQATTEGTLRPVVAITAGVDPLRAATGDIDGDVVLGDVDGDGHVDAVVSHLEVGTIGVYPGRGDGSFGAPLQFAAGPVPGHLVLADVDMDGLLDVAVASASDHQVRVLRNRGEEKR